VIFFYSTGDLVAFDLDGRRLWSRNIQTDYGTFAFLWTFASSPTLFDGKLYVQVLQRDVAVQGRGHRDRPNESYLLALDPKSGKTLWRQTRPSEAVAESREAFSTPIPVSVEGRAQLLITGGDAITGHDPQTGKELCAGARGIPGGSRTGGWSPRRWPAGEWRSPAPPRAAPCMPSSWAAPASWTTAPCLGQRRRHAGGLFRCPDAGLLRW
jgi:outer membrane protein assembly factor BamB